MTIASDGHSRSRLIRSEAVACTGSPPAGEPVSIVAIASQITASDGEQVTTFGRQPPLGSVRHTAIIVCQRLAQTFGSALDLGHIHRDISSGRA